MADFRAARQVENRDLTRSTVVIIGAGISGICMAIDLLRRTPCRNFVLLEKGSQVGGTWFDNKYPGCACDVWSSLYSYSFAQKTDWSREYPGQEELLDYVIGVAEAHRLFKYIRFNSTVQEARWDDAALQWKLDVAVTGAKDSQFQDSYELTTDFLVSAVGQLNMPSWPSIPGMDDFSGKLMHSARWDWSYDYSGKRVAIIGNGATAVQIAPEIAKSVSQMAIFQRTPNWVVPRLDRSVSGLQQFLLTYIPPLRWCKRAFMMCFREAAHAGVTDNSSTFAQRVRMLTPQAVRASMPDKPELWEKLVPTYSPGCKRVLLSDDYFPTLNKKNVDLELRGIRRVIPEGIEMEDGQVREFDLLVVATGFRSVEFMHPIRVFGRGGRSLGDIWRDGAAAYRGVTVEDLPNFGMLYGPNTNLGHNSIILMIEAQSRYLSTLIGEVVGSQAQNQTLVLQPRSDAVHEFNERIQARLAQTSFADSTCKSWYKTASGRITNNWPGTAVEYQKELAQVKWTDYVVEGDGKDKMDGKKTSYIGRVKEESPVSNFTLLVGVIGVAATVGRHYYLW